MAEVGSRRALRAVPVAIAAALVFAAVVRAQTLVSATRGRPDTGVVTATAPIYLLPDERRVPLVIAQEGSTVSILGESDGWVNVEFSHDGYERRQGFIATAFVRPAGALPASGAAPAMPGLARLTERQKAEAVEKGLALNGALAGVLLRDAGSPAASSADPASTPLSLRLYTPAAWIEQQASDAARERRPFTVANITSDMLQPVLRVIAYPARPLPLNDLSAAEPSPAEHILLRDDTRRLVVQPVSKTHFTDTLRANAPGRAFQGLMASFDLTDVREIGGPNRDREFLVVVVGYGGRSERTFKIGAKELEALPY